MSTKMSLPSLFVMLAVTLVAVAVLALAMLAPGAANSQASSEPKDAAPGKGASASVAPPSLPIDAKARDAEYYSASGEGQFTASGGLVGDRQ